MIWIYVIFFFLTPTYLANLYIRERQLYKLLDAVLLLKRCVGGGSIDVIT